MKTNVQVIELASVILVLSIEVLIGIILAQVLKSASKDKTAWLGSYGFVAVGS